MIIHSVSTQLTFLICCQNMFATLPCNAQYLIYNHKYLIIKLEIIYFHEELIFMLYCTSRVYLFVNIATSLVHYEISHVRYCECFDCICAVKTNCRSLRHGEYESIVTFLSIVTKMCA